MATEITNLYQLNNIRNLLSEDYVLMNDIDMSPTAPSYNPEWDEDKIDYKIGDVVGITNWLFQTSVYLCIQDTNGNLESPITNTLNWGYLWEDNGKGWDPIGTSSFKFTGTYDGQNYKLTNLYINRPSTDNIGLFGYCSSDSSILNLNIINCNIVGANYVGGICGRMSNTSTIEGCFCSGNVTGNGTTGRVGGNVGYVENTGVWAVKQCAFDGIVDSKGSFVGGNVGDARGCIQQCWAYGTVRITGATNKHSVGGNAGLSWTTGSFNGHISDCFSGASVSASGGNDNNIYVGGNVGRAISSVDRCYAYGLVSGAGNRVGGNIGYIDVGWSQSRCYYDKQTTGKTDITKGTPKTTSEMQTQSTFTGWDFFTLINQDSIWYMPINDYPKLMSEMSETPNFIGLTLSEANAIASENSFVLGTVTYYYHPTVVSGKVISYDPIYSASGSIINLVISKGIDSNRIDDYVSKDNTIVVYIKDNDKSKELADYYSIKHNINTEIDGPIIDGYGRWEIKGQTIGINCSSTEILDSEDIFDDEILIPLQEALNTSFLSSQDIRCIVLGYNVPGGFYSDVSSPIIISSTSRISRGCAKKDNIFHDFSLKIKNKLYNQQVFSRLDDINSEFCIVCSRIDAPSLILAKEFVDNAINTSNQFFINGKIYIDPYYGDTSDDGIIYKDSILYCYNTLIPKIKNESFITNYINPTFNSIIPYLENDSFMWSWSKSFAYPDLFKKSIYPRVFLYNADSNSAETFRDSNINKWGIQSMLAGYCCYAGAMSNPGITGYLDSLSFFRYLYNGATVGEAFLYSCPFLDWTIGLFGDPLVKISFPLSDTIIEKIDVDYGWEMIFKKIERVLAYLIKKQNESFEIRDTIINSGIVDLEVDTLIPSNNLYLINNDTSIFSTMTKPIRDLFDFILKKNRNYGLDTQFPSINTYLTKKGYKISDSLVNLLENTQIDGDNILDEGWWELEFILQDEYFGYENYFFQLEIYEDENCTIKAVNPNGQEINIFKSNESILGWTYEKEEYGFRAVPSTGIPTSFVGRKIRYTSRKDTLSNINEYLNRGQVYYFKIRQFIVTEEGEQYFDWVIIEDIIYS